MCFHGSLDSFPPLSGTIDLHVSGSSPFGSWPCASYVQDTLLFYSVLALLRFHCTIEGAVEDMASTTHWLCSTITGDGCLLR